MPEPFSIKDRTAVVGIGQTSFAKGLEDTELSLACQAISMAIDDAGLTPGDVDGLAMYSMEDGREVDVARNVGLGDVTWFSEVGFGGGAGCGVVGQAAMAVATGQCQVAVAWRARKRAAKASRPWAQVVGPARRPSAVEPAVRAPAPGRRDRDAHPPGHAPVRLHARPPRERRARVPQARAAQPQRDHGPQAPDPRAVHGGALDLRAAVPVRQLPRDRRRARGRDHERRARPRPPPTRPPTSTRSRRASRNSTR